MENSTLSYDQISRVGSTITGYRASRRGPTMAAPAATLTLAFCNGLPKFNECWKGREEQALEQPTDIKRWEQESLAVLQHGLGKKEV